MAHVPVFINGVFEQKGDNGASTFVLDCSDIVPANHLVKLHKASAASVNKLRSLTGKPAMVPLAPYLMNGNSGFSFKEDLIFELPPSQAGTVTNLSDPAPVADPAPVVSPPPVVDPADKGGTKPLFGGK
jgi:hypothetical protein